MRCGICGTGAEERLSAADTSDGRPRVVHITTHLGGGIGRVLSRVTALAARAGKYRHEIVCLEEPEKTGFVEYAKQNNVPVHVAPEPARIVDLCESASIVQFDWWHHPLMARCLVTTPWPRLRSVVWSHISGMSPPYITAPFVALPDAFVFSTPYSLESPLFQRDKGGENANVAMIHSSGGFDDLPVSDDAVDRAFTAGYVGTLNFSKMHPEYIDYCAASGVADVRYLLVGDETTRHLIEEQARARGIADQVRFAGYVEPIWQALRQIDVLAYLLNPEHYGTTENALLEAMAYGIPPIVLDQCAEKYLVRNRETGIVVHDKKEFGEALRFLKERPDERRRLGINARAFVTTELSCENTVQRLHACYDRVMERPKTSIDFTAVFGSDPADWFLSCQGKYRGIYEDSGVKQEENQAVPSVLTEPTKSSVYHFLRYFPKNKRLKRMAERIGVLRGRQECDNLKV